MKTTTIKYKVNSIPYKSTSTMEAELLKLGFTITTSFLSETKIILNIDGLKFTVKWKEVALSTNRSLYQYKEQLLRNKCIKKIYYHLIYNKEIN